MTHQDKGHFAAKHEGETLNPVIAEKLESMAKDNCVPCAFAHKTSKVFETTPKKIGVQIDLLEFRIIQCQLGLYGYSDGGKKIDPDIDISPDLTREIEDVSRDGRITCLECWNIAKRLKIKKLDVSSACEKKNIKIKHCQLGAF